jgi:hypothetical protein
VQSKYFNKILNKQTNGCNHTLLSHMNEIINRHRRDHVQHILCEHTKHSLYSLSPLPHTYKPNLRTHGRRGSQPRPCGPAHMTLDPSHYYWPALCTQVKTRLITLVLVFPLRRGQTMTTRPPSIILILGQIH